MVASPPTPAGIREGGASSKPFRRAARAAGKTAIAAIPALIDHATHLFLAARMPRAKIG